MEIQWKGGVSSKADFCLDEMNGCQIVNISLHLNIFLLASFIAEIPVLTPGRVNDSW